VVVVAFAFVDAFTFVFEFASAFVVTFMFGATFAFLFVVVFAFVVAVVVEFEFEEFEMKKVHRGAMRHYCEECGQGTFKVDATGFCMACSYARSRATAPEPWDAGIQEVAEIDLPHWKQRPFKNEEAT